MQFFLDTLSFLVLFIISIQITCFFITGTFIKSVGKMINLIFYKNINDYLCIFSSK